MLNKLCAYCAAAVVTVRVAVNDNGHDKKMITGTAAVRGASPGMMQLMNMAGVVASPNWATLTPWLAIPATMEVSSRGPDNLESLPICTVMFGLTHDKSDSLSCWVAKRACTHFSQHCGLAPSK